jgi:hypothetical protein
MYISRLRSNVVSVPKPSSIRHSSQPIIYAQQQQDGIELFINVTFDEEEIHQ